ncbi:hypothetical protein AXY43_08125 [Clostridium sp. MF28]|uniref:Uncharacterized protein n=1 Tax=Clostridium diolis TaxID=223919 RepID=A0AAV3W9A2_9CLOT|nr:MULTISPECIES: hypothetical protein [Clostridium]AVK47994.1 hypothetical protein AXY43_08125 [Clostridium sp. MF28]PSM57388.1 hypothetical protein C4L39_12740 [Clostridium diolis]QES75033.1 hypothetical protein F3K33_20450 [Clostridium diolis]GEA33847.1 hypothetical protein CDIOL_47700 [Clostridium diolis]
MLRLTVFEFIFRLVPEAFVLILAMIALSNVKLNSKRYIISSLLLAVCEYGIRLLPINYGVPTILDIFVMIIIMWSINKADVVLSIKSSLITTIVLFMCEGLNMLLLNIAFRNSLDVIMLNPVLKEIYGLPSLVCFAIITLIYYLKKGMLRDV